MRCCILTRADLFPTNHGAAVKIIQTALALSNKTSQPCFIVTDNRQFYLRCFAGEVEEVPFPPRIRAAQEWGLIKKIESFSEKICQRLGYPADEFFLYRPQFEPSWLLRALWVGEAEKVDVFQAEFPGYGIPATIASKILSVKRFLLGGRRPTSSIVQHNVEWDRLREFGHQVKWIRRMELLSLKLVDEVVAVSVDDKRRMVTSGIDPSKITVIPHGVDTKAFEVTKASSEKIRAMYDLGAHPVVFFHGTLHYWPNTQAVRFIRQQILPRLLPIFSNVRVVICGMNPPVEYAHPNIIFPGAVSDLAAHISLADICICPLFSGGGTRLKLLEYMAAGKAIVSTSKGAEGIPLDGQMVIVDEIDEMVDEIVGLLRDGHRAAQLGARALRFAQKFDWKNVTEGYLDIYSGVGRGNNYFQPPSPLCSSIERHLPERVPSKELTLLFLINRGCNLRCSFCDLWEGVENIPFEKAIAVLDDAVQIGTQTVVLTGGEPFIHPRFFDIVKAAKARGLTVNVTTNGTLIDKHWEQITLCGVDSLSFSIDGLSQTHDRIRGRSGAWEKTVQGLKRVTKETSIHTSVYFVATNQNVAELIAVYKMVRDIGASFDFWPVNDAKDLYITTPSQQQMWTSAVDFIADREKTVQNRIQFYRDSLRYHSEGFSGKAFRCLGLIDQYGVTYEGDFLPCCVWGGDGLRIGNVFQRSLVELWYSPKVQEYRERLYNQGCSAGCFNHSLYEFSESTNEKFYV